MIRIVKAITLPLTLLLLILAFTVGIAHSQTVNGKYDGDGDRLIEVSNLEQLNAVRYDVNGDGRPDRDSDASVYSLAFPVGGAEAVCDEGCHGYELAGPLDFGEAGSYASGAVRAGWTSGSGWEPIGVDTSGRRFSATFDGNGHTVSNLYIDRAIGSDRSSGVGLFGVAGESSVIRGIGLVNAEVHGYSWVGGLVGKHSGTISDSYATGNVTGSDDDVGGLVGKHSGTISDSYATGNVTGSGNNVGGLVGENTGQVSDSYATGGVTGSGNNVGGLVGRSAGPISDSYATGSVTGSSVTGRSYYVGGLVGGVGSDKTVIASYATGNVSGYSHIGGLVGNAGSGATFTASYATGNVSGYSHIGGLVGNAGSGITVIAGYATGSVTASSNYVGGLVGFGPGATVIASYATGRVSGVSDVGGLFGYGSGTTFIASYWDTGTSGQMSGVRGENVAGAEGKTTAELQSPTGDTGIYVAWNTDLDNADVDGNSATGAEDYWDFGTSSQYPALKVDIDGNGVATWQEFGGQGRVPPPTPPLLPTPPPTVNGKYDGDGDRLIEVSNLEQLNAVRYDVNGDGRPDRDSDASVYSLAFPVGGTEAVCDKRCHGYELAGPLDFGEAGSYASGAVRAGWTSGSGWEPIGVDTSGRRFSATFDGNGHTVSNLYIDRAIGSDRSSGVGLFGVAGESSVIRGIGLVNAEVHGYSWVGGLVGKHSGTISDSYATGNVTGSDDDVGGLVGKHSGTISDSYATGTVSGGNNVGGLVGENTGQVSDSYATGGVTGSGNNVGGLVGRSAGPISDSYATGSVTGRSYYVGGLVGGVGSDKTVIASYATGNVSGYSHIGGLVGNAGSGATFTASYATGNVSGYSHIGGLVGNAGSGITVIAGYATGSVTASSNYVGGLVGFGPGATVIASYATGRVSGVSDVGGLFGYGSGTTFIASYWDTGTSGQRSGVRGENVAGAEGKTTAELQSPTGDTGIYVAWNTDLDNADVDGNSATGAEDYWDFGTSSQYPALKVDIDGNGVATWQEFGGQGRVPPPTPPLLPTPPPTVNGKYDGDGDRLIEVSNLEQLNAVRYDVNGDGRPDRDSDASVYSLAFPVGGTEAVCDKRCHGYELAGPLDFGEAGSYASGAVRAGWTSGSGWEPIGVDTSGRRFSATFDGNGHTVSNLYIDRAIGSDRSSGVGLFGVAGESSVIRGIGLVNAEVHGYSWVGGLVGKHSGTISDSYATGNVTGSDDDVGGLVGKHSGTISDSYATGNVTGSGNNVGGLVGENTGQVSDSYATGGVTGSGNNVGGLVGRSAGPISDSYATGSVTGSSVTGRSYYVGGLVGGVGSDKTVIASYATGNVSGYSHIGGLVGNAGSGATFTASYATGNVSGYSHIGGLVGNAGSGITVIAGYATGSVTASSNYVGGLVGFGPGATVIASYATGRVSGVSDVGGLFGYGSGTTFIASYWDTGTSGQMSGVRGENVAGAEGKTTAELQSPTGDTGIYVAWNTDLDNADVDGNSATGAEDYWDFGTSSQYPALKVDIDGNGVATWQEFGGQGRVPPPTPPLLPTPPPTVNGKYDGDGDRLIEVSNLEQLNAVRYDVNGDGRPDRDSDASVYSLAFPVGGTEAVCDKRCHGYELAGPLDFGEAGSYASGAVRAGWTSGSGWEPIGVDTSGRRFSATFDGNGHTVSNLYIDRAIGSDRSSGVGLFGVAGESSVIRGIGLVNAEVHGYSWVGGLVGKHSGTISDSYATGNVTGSDDDVGGLVGKHSGTISDSYATGNVTGSGNNVGGLVGENTGQVSDSYATGGVTGSGNNVGGLVGRSAGPISDSYATGSVTGSSVTGRSYYVGGLVGGVGSDKTVIASYATGNVSGYSHIGGLVGNAGSGATFTASYATGNVSGYSHIGGLVGNAGSGITVIAGYATGSVTASSNYVGGLVGFGPGATVIASYATGRVSGVSDVGGLFGYGSGTTFIASYWDTGTSDQMSGVRGENVAGAEGKTTAELQSPTGDTGIYVAWNTDLDNADVDGNSATGAEDYWDFGTSSQYPALKVDIDGNGVATWQEFGRQRMNTPPEFPAAQTERSVPENPAEGENIGRPVVAEDAEDDTLTYALGGADAGSFDIVASSGQLQTKAALDFETKFSYMVTVSVHDGQDADWNADTTSDATVTVTITVANVDETPEVTGEAAVDYQENGAGAVAAYTATEPDNDPITWSLSGPDMGAFGIGSDGELTFNMPPDFEGPSDADTDNVYEVTVEAFDGGATPGTLDVTVTVANVDETPEVTGEAAVDYQENGAGAVAAYTATEPDNDPITWSLSGPDMGAFGIGSDGELTFNMPPDFEGPADADTDNVYEVTVEASDGGATPGTLDVTVTVANVDETPEVTLSSPNPQLGVPLIATLNDPEDGAVAGVTWQWASSSDGSTWTDIEGATHETYTPVAEDVGKYLRATAEYTDGEGSFSTAQPVSDALVATNTAPEFPATETGERSVLEKTPEGGNIGAPVAATDADDDILTYTLGGADAGSFDIDPGMGQIQVGAGTTPAPAVRDTYTVVVTATDPSGADATITVTITVTSLLKQYDSDGNGAISRNEAVAAVRDYFSGNLTREQTIAVIRLYFVSVG